MSFMLRRAALAVVASVAFIAHAGATELCVVCTGPSATYRCQIENAGVTGTQAQVLCITELAKTGGHASCSVERHADVPCDGSLAVVRPDLATDGPAVASPNPSDIPAPLPDEAEPAQAQSADDPDPVPAGPPTVARELKKAGKAASDTAKVAGEKIQGASDAVGSAAKKSWDCLKSFFGNC